MAEPEFTDPRELGGSMAGPGGPFEHGGVIVDTRRAILVDFHEICKIDEGARGQEAFAWIVEGRINQTQDRASVMFLGDLDLIAAMITQMHGVAERAGRLRELHQLCNERWAEMPHG